MSEDKIIAKIKKLLALANGNAAGGEHERDTAMQMALKMLAKHNLEMTDVSDVEKEKRGMQKCYHRRCPWRRKVAMAVSRMFFCQFFYYANHGEGTKHQFVFVGLESNATIAMEMTDYLVKSIKTEARRVAREQNQSTKFATTFMNAAANRVDIRTWEMQKASEKEAPTPGTSIVLANYYETEKKENQLFVDTNCGPLKSVKIKLNNYEEAGRVAGDNYGKTVSLNNQLT